MALSHNQEIHTTNEELHESSKFVEDSPTKRFSRTDNELGHGAYKRVFLALDHFTGKEVAWNTIRTQNISKREKERILEEIRLYEQLNNPYILKLIKAWRNKAKDEVVMITELMSCSLKEYLHKNPEFPRLKVIKYWCKSILLGLEYLHSRTPPVIHRDLKCDNIFVLSSSGEIRIGDLGLSTTLKESHLKSQVGTPYFMAPEMYEERYGPSVDIYSFGLCIIEMCTLTTPYSECKNQASLFHKIKSGQKPDAFFTIDNLQIRELISQCIVTANARPTATQLLNSEFFLESPDDPLVNEPILIISSEKNDQELLETAETVSLEKVNTLGPAKTPAYREIIDILIEEGKSDTLNVMVIAKNADDTKFKVNFDFKINEEVPEVVAEELVKYASLNPDSLEKILIALESNINKKKPVQIPEQRTPSFHGKAEDRIMNFPIKLGIISNNTIKKVQVEITFDLDKDTAENVAKETIQHLGIDAENYPHILKLIKNKISDVDNEIYSTYSCLDLLDMDNDPESTQTAGKQQFSTTESVASEVKSSYSYSSRNSSFEKFVKSHLQQELPFSGNISPIGSFVEVKSSPPKSDEEDCVNSLKHSNIKGVISKKNTFNESMDVKKLQEALAVIFNCALKVDGVYSKKTERKVKMFQAKNHLNVDGIVNQKLWEMIMSCKH